MSADPYLDAGSGVLANKLGITSERELQQAERDITRVRMFELARNPLPGNYDLQHLQAMHKHIFQDIYTWAGELRTVQMLAPDRQPFAMPERIESAGNVVFKSLAQDQHLKGMFTDKFLDRAATHFANVNALHPFRDGNGRATRLFFEQMSREAGKPLDLSVNNRDQWLQASALSLSGDTRQLRDSFRQAFIAGRDMQHSIER